MTENEFWDSIDRSGNCWVWTRGVDGHNYGQCRFGGKQKRAHRVAYELIRGEIPGGLDIDHLCRNTLCVRLGQARYKQRHTEKSETR